MNRRLILTLVCVCALFTASASTEDKNQKEVERLAQISAELDNKKDTLLKIDSHLGNLLAQRIDEWKMVCEDAINSESTTAGRLQHLIDNTFIEIDGSDLIDSLSSAKGRVVAREKELSRPSPENTPDPIPVGGNDNISKKQQKGSRSEESDERNSKGKERDLKYEAGSESKGKDIN